MRIVSGSRPLVRGLALGHSLLMVVVLGGLVVDGFMYGGKAEDGFVSGAGARTGAGAGAGERAGAVSEMGSLECRLQGSPRLPAFSQDGDFILGGVFSIHYYMYRKDDSYTVQPQALECTGRSVI